MKRKNIARNKLSVLTGATDNVINRYYNNTITRLDLDVLARICFVLDCNISDIIEYKK
ncbi:MAG: helix-turn-helix transcriptional regulator [Clostridia bacterium]|nr:helix-turn-helix transcriptional regulator [Clostridia bacterium]